MEGFGAVSLLWHFKGVLRPKPICMFFYSRDILPQGFGTYVTGVQASQGRSSWITVPALEGRRRSRGRCSQMQREGLRGLPGAAREGCLGRAQLLPLHTGPRGTDGERRGRQVLGPILGWKLQH